MATEPDNRPPQVVAAEPDWDNVDASYEAPGAREVVPDLPPIPDVTTPNPPVDANTSSTSLPFDCRPKRIRFERWSRKWPVFWPVRTSASKMRPPSVNRIGPSGISPAITSPSSSPKVSPSATLRPRQQCQDVASFLEA